ncbi:MAG: hypothetical protein KDA57_20995, partial [Planctomycetales bacterium]|nr:hypothetical protein [Planctomycetales bacterium]
MLRGSLQRRLALLVVLGSGLIYVACIAEELAPVAAPPEAIGTPVAALLAATQRVPERFVGPEACMDCHEAEYVVWSHSDHATNAYNLLRTSSNAKRYAEKLGIDADRVASAPQCLVCHATPQDQTGNRTGRMLGVSCESCHNGAGGEEGWLNAHATYGPGVARRERESAAHRQQRIDRCRAAGHFRCDDLYSLARQCYQCHVVGDEALVVRGGHHPGDAGFEMVSWFDKQIRHNLFLDPSRNGLAPSLWADPRWRPNRMPGNEKDHRRQMYVVAMLVDLELSLRNRAAAEHASFASAAATRIVAAKSRLNTIAEDDLAEVLRPVVHAVAELESLLFTPPAKN